MIESTEKRGGGGVGELSEAGKLKINGNTIQVDAATAAAAVAAKSPPNWMQKLERINATNKSNDYLERNRPGTGSPFAQLQQQQHQQQQHQQQQQLLLQQQQDSGEEDFCFKASSLVTEIVLILFAVCLLLIASIVILSKRVPSFMESYEIVPMVLFILCIALAVCSFVRWLATKILRLVRRSTVRSTSTSSSSAAATNYRLQSIVRPNSSEKSLQEGRALIVTSSSSSDRARLSEKSRQISESIEKMHQQHQHDLACQPKRTRNSPSV